MAPPSSGFEDGLLLAKTPPLSCATINPVTIKTIINKAVTNRIMPMIILIIFNVRSAFVNSKDLLLIPVINKTQPGTVKTKSNATTKN